MARKRAQQRWSALLARVSKWVREALGESLWADFVAHADAHYKRAFVAAFDSPHLACVGPPSGAPCPNAFCVDLTSATAFATLEHLHLDHEQDLAITCDMWARTLATLPHGPSAWDDGINAALLCHLLFSVRADSTHGTAMLRFRCGPGAARCHKLNMPHYRGLRNVSLP